jgi:hypothetical protein
MFSFSPLTEFNLIQGHVLLMLPCQSLPTLILCRTMRILANFVAKALGKAL